MNKAIIPISEAIMGGSEALAGGAAAGGLLGAGLNYLFPKRESDQQPSNQEPIFNSEGRRIPLARIDLLPPEEMKIEEGLQDESFNSDDYAQEDQPLLSQVPEQIDAPLEVIPTEPPRGIFRMGLPPQMQQQEQERVNRDRQEMFVEQQAREFAQAGEYNVPQAEREEWSVFARNLYLYMVEEGNGQVILNDVALGLSIWRLYQEQTMPAITDQESQQEQNESGNVQRHKWFEEHGVPPQCRRRLYTDQNGVLRSVVICDSFGDQRVYHDK